MTYSLAWVVLGAHLWVHLDSVSPEYRPYSVAAASGLATERLPVAAAAAASTLAEAAVAESLAVDCPGQQHWLAAQHCPARH